MTPDVRKRLDEVDNKLGAIRRAKGELEQLERFLMTQRQAIVGEGGVYAQVSVSDDEVNERIRKAGEIFTAWRQQR